MRLLRLAILTAACATLASPAVAQVGTMKFLSGSGVTAFGVYVGTYKAQLDGANIDVWCVDFLNHVSAGNVYQVNITNLGGTPDLSKTRFGSLGVQPATYRQAAWLASQFLIQPTTSWGAIHAAIWHLTTPGTPNVSGALAAQVAGWITAAQTNYQKYYYNNVYVLTDVAVERCAAANPAGAPWTGCGKQEHVYIDGQLTVTPEPATMGLLATGLVAMGAGTIFRRRRRSR